MPTELPLPEVALSIRQPWAWLIVRPDITDPAARAEAMRRGEIKSIENRSWVTHFRGPIWIHAAKTFTAAEYHVAKCTAIRMGVEVPSGRDLQVSGIVGRATIVDCVNRSPRMQLNSWFFGPFGFVLADIEPVTFRPCKGALGFFKPKFLEAA